MTLLIDEGHPEGGVIRDDLKLVSFRLERLFAFTELVLCLFLICNVPQEHQVIIVALIHDPRCGDINEYSAPIFLQALKFISRRAVSYTHLRAHETVLDI